MGWEVRRVGGREGGRDGETGREGELERMMEESGGTKGQVEKKNGWRKEGEAGKDKGRESVFLEKC